MLIVEPFGETLALVLDTGTGTYRTAEMATSDDGIGLAWLSEYGTDRESATLALVMAHVEPEPAPQIATDPKPVDHVIEGTILDN